MGVVIPGCDEAPEKPVQPALPVVETLETVGISTTSAVSGGKVLSSGSGPLTSRGVCWNQLGKPTIEDSRKEEGMGVGTFTSIIEGLEEATSYFVRAYAINPAGIAYGGQDFFTTATLATVTTSDISDITSNSATSGGDVLWCGGASVTARGVCWSTDEIPTTEDEKTIDGKNIGSFKSRLSGLSGHTTYFVRAYAVNSVGTAYGNQLKFKTE